MNPILLVLPILSLLMFDLGLTLRLSDFGRLARRPLPVVVGLAGQLVVLPALAFLLAWAFRLPPLMSVGLILVACCPGGSSSNVFSKLAGGDVALSVTLTALSSVITLFTVPVVLSWAVMSAGGAEQSIRLPVGNLLVQNLVLMALPIGLGVVVKRLWPRVAERVDGVLSRLAFPALMFLAGIFFVQHWQTIVATIGQLGAAVLALILLATGAAWLLSRLAGTGEAVRRTIVIEVGMQNAAQAIAIASSPFVFNDDRMAIPAIIYALLMNVVLLVYVWLIRRNRGAYSMTAD